jgi:hypothetical protein
MLGLGRAWCLCIEFRAKVGFGAEEYAQDPINLGTQTALDTLNGESTNL